MKTIVKKLGAVASLTVAISTALAALPDPGMQIDKGRTALVVTDPQNDFLSPNGVTWGVVGKNVEANNTVENIDALFKTTKAWCACASRASMTSRSASISTSSIGRWACDPRVTRAFPSWPSDPGGGKP